MRIPRQDEPGDRGRRENAGGAIDRREFLKAGGLVSLGIGVLAVTTTRRRAQQT